MRFLIAALLAVPGVLAAQVTEVWSTKGPYDYPFGKVIDVVSVSPDRIWVLDPLGSYHVHVLDGSGTLVKRIVRDGDGPGEMRSALQGEVTPEGNIALLGVRSIQVLDGDGRYVSQTRLPFSTPGGTDFVATGEYFVRSGGMYLLGQRLEKSVVVVDRGSGEIVRSFHPGNATPGRAGVYQSGVMLDIAGSSVIAVTVAPIEIVEYALDTGRRIRVISPPDSSLVNDPGPAFQFHRREDPNAIFYRWYYPRVVYVTRLDRDRLLVVTRFSWQDYAWRAEEDALDIPVEEYERSVWDVYDLTTGTRISRTQAPRGYVVYDRAPDGDFLAGYLTQLDESAVVKLRFGPG